MHPVLASKFLTKLDKSERDILIKTGIIPVNDVLIDLYREYNQVWLLFGGRGGGKSEVVFDRLINNCINDEYFNCYFGRKVWDTVHESCFETLVACIKKQGKTHLFSFSEADNSSMVVRCKANGNKFQPFGADKPEKLKSIKDPTHIVCEEFDQFTFLDFQELYPTLRTIRANCEFFGMFNTKSVYPDHWLIMIFFPELYTGTEKIQFDALAGVKIKKIFVNFTDNYFIDQEAYYQQLRLASGGNQILLDSIANGAWGVQENGNPWLHACNPTKHFKDVSFLPSYPIYISFDFNNDPFACTIRQSSPHMGGSSSFIHYIDEIVGQFKVEDTCQIIKARYPSSIIYITGDRSGSNEDLGRNQTLYQIIAGLLNLNESQINTNTANLLHSDSRLLLNAMFQHYPNLYIDSKCKQLRIDCQKAAVDGESKLPSHLKKDREGFKMDVFDAMRYDFQTYFNKWAKETYFKVLKIK